MKNIIEQIKNFQYKTISVVGLMIISQVIYQMTHSKFAGIFSLSMFFVLVGFIYMLIYKGLKNTYQKDGSKTLAIVLGSVVIIFTSFVAYLIINFLINGII